MIEAIRKLVRAIVKPGSPEAAFADAVCDDIAKTQQRHDERQSRIQRSMARGARLTDHRFKL